MDPIQLVWALGGSRRLGLLGAQVLVSQHTWMSQATTILMVLARSSQSRDVCVYIYICVNK